ncbi:MAG: hypothetical protein AAFQ63_21570 [Cyanobacteria bacterium J06621_11]
MQFSFGLLISLGMSLPILTEGAIASSKQYRADSSEVAELAAKEISLPIELQLNTQIPNRDQSSYLLPIEHGVMFEGNANEMLVVYWDHIGTSATAEVELYDSDGQRVPYHHRSFYDIELSESDGRHHVFLLLKTGEHRLVFRVGDTKLPLISRDMRTPIPRPVYDVEHLLRLRVASYFERLMLAAHEHREQNRLEEALAMFTLAAEHRPDLPQPYMGRVAIFAERALATLEGNAPPLESMRLAFQSLEVEEQSLVISDLRRAAENYTAAISGGITTLGDFEPALLSHTADYLEMGVASDDLVEAIEGW